MAETKNWVVKDSFGEIITVKAEEAKMIDDMTVAFKSGSDTVAIFNSWIYFKLAPED